MVFDIKLLWVFEVCFEPLTLNLLLHVNGKRQYILYQLPAEFLLFWSFGRCIQLKHQKSVIYFYWRKYIIFIKFSEASNLIDLKKRLLLDQAYHCGQFFQHEEFALSMPLLRDWKDWKAYLNWSLQTICNP